MDLHVAKSHVKTNELLASHVRNLYWQRRRAIDVVLHQLQALSPDDICRMVHEAIMSRTSGPPVRDAFLARDVKEIRSLSLLAAGFGGKMLASIFRSLCYDYRHYSGGMPDLLLVRGIYNDDRSEARDFSLL
ncbi:MAG: hypothetical protein ACRDL7_11800 [Gaiellaceae bacterium]